VPLSPGARGHGDQIDMRRLASALLFIVPVFVPCLPLAAEFPAPRVVTLTDHVLVLLGPVQHANQDNQGYMINSTIIIGNQGVVLVDPGGTDEVGRFIAQHIAKYTDRPVSHVVNTHAHGDHYLGNTAFPEATIISSAACRDSVIQTGDQWKRLMESMVGREFPDTRPLAASLVYPANSKTRTTIEGVEMIFWVPPGSHTEGDMMIYLPVEKILIAGDVLVNGVVPTMQDGIVKNWISVLQEVADMDAGVYVPGHGDLMNRQQVRSLREAIAHFYAEVRRGYEDGLDESEIRDRLDLAEWQSLERAYVIGRNINRVYLEVEQDLF